MSHRTPSLRQMAGFSLVETIVSLGVVSVVMMTIASVNLQLKRVTTKAASRSELDLVRQNIVSNIMNDGSWQRTIDHAQNQMTCLRTPGGGSQTYSNPWCVFLPQLCGDGGTLGDGRGGWGGGGGRGGCTNVGRTRSMPFTLLDPYGQVLFDGRDAQRGFTTSGRPCGGYPSTNCPYSYDLRWWTTSGNSGAIVGVQVQMKLGPNYRASNPFNSLNLNADRYSVPVIYRAPRGN